MTCDQSIELLPWLLNGTLDAEERAEVRHHLATCERCRQALTETRQAWTVFAQHIPAKDLVALAWGNLPSEIDAPVAEEHLASCAQCAAELEMTRMSRRLEEEENVAVFPAARPRPATGAAPRTWRAAAIAASLATAVAAAGWIYSAQEAGNLDRIARTGTPVQAPAPAQSRPQPPTSETSRMAQLQVQVERLLGLQQENEKGLEKAKEQIAQLEGERESWRQPQPGVIADLGSGLVVRNGENEDLKAIFPGDNYILLNVPARDGRASEKRHAEIVDGSGKVVRRVDHLVASQGYYFIVLPPDTLKPGLYTLRISGREESWPFKVAKTTAPS
jgi:anti-sigma factor RsiW